MGEGPSDGGAIRLEDLDINPYPAYRALRDEGVVWVEAIQRWLVTRWDDVIAVETDRVSYSAMERDSLQTRVMGRTMLRSDGAAHKRLRRAAQDPLRPATVDEQWRPLFQQFADGLIDGFAGRGGAELMTEYAAPLAARCLGAVLGLPDASGDELQFWSQALMDGTSNYGDDASTWERSERACDQIDAHVDAAIERARERPDSSVISAMALSDGDGEPLSRDEIRANVKLLIGGGLNEPRDGTGVALWGLLSNPGQLERAIAEPELWPLVTEEALRWISPLALFARQVVAPVTLGSTRLEPGARLGINVGAANRDERHYERPDEFDITRPKTRNLAFGVGHHFCLGVWMSRHQIGSVALPTLFRRLPGLRLDLDRPAELRGWVFRGPVHLQARWDAGGAPQPTGYPAPFRSIAALSA
ncbi:MAG: hypothetical protein QOG77_1406 [Solirubrobacteraceae bacterium]|nr:hypothetical protein [Solirubrobacteraceae bacterium]